MDADEQRIHGMIRTFQTQRIEQIEAFKKRKKIAQITAAERDLVYQAFISELKSTSRKLLAPFLVTFVPTAFACRSFALSAGVHVATFGWVVHKNYRNGAMAGASLGL